MQLPHTLAKIHASFGDMDLLSRACMIPVMALYSIKSAPLVEAPRTEP